MSLPLHKLRKCQHHDQLIEYICVSRECQIYKGLCKQCINDQHKQCKFWTIENFILDLKSYQNKIDELFSLARQSREIITNFLNIEFEEVKQWKKQLEDFEKQHNVYPNLCEMSTFHYTNENIQLIFQLLDQKEKLKNLLSKLIEFHGVFDDEFNGAGSLVIMRKAENKKIILIGSIRKKQLFGFGKKIYVKDEKEYKIEEGIFENNFLKKGKITIGEFVFEVNSEQKFFLYCDANQKKYQRPQWKYISYNIQENSEISLLCVNCLERNEHRTELNIKLFNQKAEKYIDSIKKLKIWNKNEQFIGFKTSFLQEKSYYRHNILAERINKLNYIADAFKIKELRINQLKILIYSMERNECSYIEREIKILEKELKPIIFRNSKNNQFYECIGEFKNENNGKGWCRSESEIKEGTIINGLLEGYGYYKRGNLEKEGWFIGGELNGKGRKCNITNQIDEEFGYFKDGILNGYGFRNRNGKEEEGMFVDGQFNIYFEDFKQFASAPIETNKRDQILKQKQFFCYKCHQKESILVDNELYYKCICGYKQCTKCLGTFTNHHDKKYNIFRCPQSSNFPYLKRLIYMFPRLIMLLILILWSPFASIERDDFLILLVSLIIIIPLLSEILIGIPGSIHRYLCRK